MKKSTKIYLFAWGVLAVAIIGFMFWPTHHNLAKEASNIEKIIKVDLPNIADSESTNNIDRCASRWDIFDHSIQFAEELSDDCVKELERLCESDSEHWSKNETEGFYAYRDEGGIDNLYEVWCQIHRGHATLTYTIDEDEGILMVALMFIYFKIMILWGLVLGIITIVRRKTK